MFRKSFGKILWVILFVFVSANSFFVFESADTLTKKNIARTKSFSKIESLEENFVDCFLIEKEIIKIPKADKYGEIYQFSIDFEINAENDSSPQTKKIRSSSGYKINISGRSPPIVQNLV